MGFLYWSVVFAVCLSLVMVCMCVVVRGVREVEGVVIGHSIVCFEQEELQPPY